MLCYKGNQPPTEKNKTGSRMEREKHWSIPGWLDQASPEHLIQLWTFELCEPLISLLVLNQWIKEP